MEYPNIVIPVGALTWGASTDNIPQCLIWARIYATGIVKISQNKDWDSAFLEPEKDRGVRHRLPAAVPAVVLGNLILSSVSK